MRPPPCRGSHAGVRPPPRPRAARGAPIGMAARLRARALMRPPTADRDLRRQAENAELCRLRASLPFCSQSALGALLQVAEREELPTGNRKRLREARDEACTYRTAYGPIHTEIQVPSGDPDGHFDLEVQSPQAMLDYMVSSCSSFAARVEDAYNKRAPTQQDPWTIVLYSDEIMPGNALAQTLHRKCWGWYWSILELGPATLSNEDATRATQTPSSGLLPIYPLQASKPPNLQASTYWAAAHPWRCSAARLAPPAGCVDGSCHRAELTGQEGSERRVGAGQRHRRPVRR